MAVQPIRSVTIVHETTFQLYPNQFQKKPDSLAVIAETLFQFTEMVDFDQFQSGTITIIYKYYPWVSKPNESPWDL